MSRLELAGVRKSFGVVEIIHGIDLVVEDGSFTVFVGPSGCGKSTLLRMIAGLEEVSGGGIVIDGARCEHLLPAARGMAMVFQSYALYPHMSVHENMRFGLVCQKTPKREIESRIKRAAEILRIEHLLQRKPSQLSGGQSQRVAIGRAIVKEPKAFLFDEPLSNLDAELRVTMRGELVALHQRLGTTMIYVTHDQVEAMTMADRIVVLRDGIIEQAGSPLELYTAPRNLFVAGFIGSPRMNFLAGTSIPTEGNRLSVSVDSGRAILQPGLCRDAARIGSSCTIGIRPEHLLPASDGSLAMIVTAREFVGSETIVTGTLGSGEAVTCSLRGFHNANPGTIVRLSIAASQMYVFDDQGACVCHSHTDVIGVPQQPAVDER